MSQRQSLLTTVIDMRVYADFNALAGRGPDCALLLRCFGTLQDLHRFQIRLAERQRLTFWDRSDEAEDLEVDAVLSFDSETHSWHAEFNSEEIRYVPHVETNCESFPCYMCRTELGSYVKPDGSEMDCPSCGLPIWFPLSAPEEAEPGAPVKRPSRDAT